MSNTQFWDMKILYEGDHIEYVEHMVRAWKDWIGRTISEISNVQSKGVRLLTYFSIIEMLAQEYYSYPNSRQQKIFTDFVLEFQNIYTFIDLTDPVTLYYRIEEKLRDVLFFDDLIEGELYYPESDVIQKKVDEIQLTLKSKGESNDFICKKLQEHRFVDLLYRMRCRLSHEFSWNHVSESETVKQPYYRNCSREYMVDDKVVSDKVWELVFPECFVRDLCVNCFGNYLQHCLDTNTPPGSNNGIDRFCELSWYSKK